MLLRDYQFDIEHKINEITKKIQSTMAETIEVANKEPDYTDILDKYQDKKIDF